MSDFWIKEIVMVFALWFAWYRRYYIYNQDNTIVTKEDWHRLKDKIDYNPVTINQDIIYPKAKTYSVVKSTICKGCGGNTGNKDTCQYCSRGV